MNRSEFAEAQSMLCLAALSYRGFEDPGVGFLHIERLRQGLAGGFKDLSPVQRRWDLAWGPVSYRAPFSVVDDSLMYVVRSRDVPDQYVVAIRGTSPISAFDWVFGDFWAADLTPWPYGNPRDVADAKISFSTALGLAILQYMRSQAPPRGAVAHLWEVLDAELGDRLRRAAAALLTPLGEAVGTQVRKIAADVRATVDTLEGARGPRRPDFAARAQAILDDWRSETRKELLRQLATALHALDRRQSLDLLRLLEGTARLRGQFGSGQDLMSFLKVAVENAKGPVDVVVTGHSKGGALASTVALWLADTQRTADFVREEERWDPKKQATVRCFSFAGPTAGNAAFAAHSDAMIGERCSRIVNRLDVVPHAWAVDQIRQIPTLYSAPVEHLRVIDDLIAQVSADVARLGYRHVGRDVTELPGELDHTRTLFFDQFVYQHMEGYLRGMELGTLMNTATFFSPLE
jgi:hypothetical protein